MAHKLDNKTRILVVEDDPHLLEDISITLSLEGHTVIRAQNGFEALHILQDVQQPLPNLIVSDIIMPRMDGFTLLETVRAELSPGDGAVHLSDSQVGARRPSSWQPDGSRPFHRQAVRPR